MIAELEVFVRRCQSWLSGATWGSRLLGARSIRGDDARGVLLVELEGLTQTGLERQLSRGGLRTLERLVRTEDYRIFPLASANQQALPQSSVPALRGARSVLAVLLWLGPAGLRLLRGLLEDQFRPRHRRTPPLVHLRREATAVVAEIGLAMGNPVVVARLPASGADRTLRRLLLLSRGSRLRDYELWVCSAGEEPFVCLPMTTRAPRDSLLALWNHALMKAEQAPLVETIEPRHPPESCLRVMTYNVHACVGVDGRLSPGRIAKVVAEHAPHVIALQELDDGRGRTGFVHQAREIANHLEMDYRFHPAMELKDGRYGNAVLSRLPLRLVKAGSLPHPGQPLEPRGALWVEVEWEGKKIQLINTHLGLLRFERLRQLEALLGPEWLGACPRPLVLLGDFNAGPGSREHRRLVETLKDANTEGQVKTWFGRLPLQTLDHAFLSPELEVLGIEAPRTSLTVVASDHLPLIVDLKL